MCAFMWMRELRGREVTNFRHFIRAKIRNLLLGNVNQIRTEGLDLNITARTKPMSWGTLGLTSNNTYLINYDVIVPSATGGTVISREGTEQGSPDQAFPDFKSVSTIDWNRANLGASLTGRYIHRVTESQNGNELNDRFYIDFQMRYLDAWLRFIGITDIHTVRAAPTFGPAEKVDAAMKTAADELRRIAGEINRRDDGRD